MYSIVPIEVFFIVHPLLLYYNKNTIVVLLFLKKIFKNININNQ